MTQIKHFRGVWGLLICIIVIYTSIAPNWTFIVTVTIQEIDYSVYQFEYL